MQTTNTTSDNSSNLQDRPRGVFHKVGLSFGQAGDIVRMNAQHQIDGVLASWLRTRDNDVDSVFVITPQALLGPAANAIERFTLTGEAQLKRFDLYILPDAQAMTALSCNSPDGYWAVVRKNRVGQSPTFRSEIFRLDDNWKEMIPDQNFDNWLSPGFAKAAEEHPSAWALMYAGLTLFGGQDPGRLQATAPSEIPDDLATAVAAERKFREGQRKLRQMSASEFDAFCARLDADQKKQVANILNGVRSGV